MKLNQYKFLDGPLAGFTTKEKQLRQGQLLTVRVESKHVRYRFTEKGLQFVATELPEVHHHD